MLVLLAAIILFGAFLLPFTVGRCAQHHDCMLTQVVALM